MASTGPWRRGSAAPATPSTRTGDMNSRWAAAPTPAGRGRGAGGGTWRGRGSSDSGGISRDGFRLARKEIGKAPAEMDMLLSPSRGLQDDEVSLKNPEVQERLRAHIDDKLRRWATAHPPSAVAPEQLKRRNEELGIILLDLRKLREGITSIRRCDAFACEVYEASALLSLFASNSAQLSSSLPPLVNDLHPARAFGTLSSPARNEPMATLESAFSGLRVTAAPSDPATRAFYLILHLAHSFLLPAFTGAAQSQSTPSAASPSSPPLCTFLPNLLVHLELAKLPPPSSSNGRRSHPDPHIAFLLALYAALVRNSYASLARLLSALPPPPPSVSTHLKALHLSSSSPPFHPLAALLLAALPALRTIRLWPVLDRAYRFPPDPAAWLAGPLLFEFEVRQQARGWDGPREERAVGESWEDEEEEGEEEAQRRAEEWVRARKGAGK
ncbi:hypothetical protein JCM10207_001902 [Rhodosporidiobolus poonsookiae]